MDCWRAGDVEESRFSASRRLVQRLVARVGAIQGWVRGMARSFRLVVDAEQFDRMLKELCGLAQQVGVDLAGRSGGVCLGVGGGVTADESKAPAKPMGRLCSIWLRTGSHVPCGGTRGRESGTW